MNSRLSVTFKTFAATLTVAALSACGSGNSDKADAVVPSSFADSLSLRYGEQWGARQNINISLLSEKEASAFDKNAFMDGLRSTLGADLSVPGVSEGISLGVELASQLDGYDAIGIYLDRAAVREALADAIGEDSIPRVQIVEYQELYDEKMSSVQNLILEKLRQERRERMNINRKIMKSNREAAKRYVDGLLSSDSSVVLTETGLLYKIVSPGKGALIRKGQSAAVVYSISGFDGRVIDSSRGEAVTISLDDELIPGLLEGLQFLSKSAEAKFYIPDHLGFSRDDSGVRPGEMITVDINVVDVL